MEIVGVVEGRQVQRGARTTVPPLFFRPYKQDDARRLDDLLRAHGGGPGPVAVGQVQRVVAPLDPNLPVDDLRTLPQQVRENVFLDRFISVLSAAFAVLATLLAAIGLYGVLAYTVAQRTREIGLRMALGAAPARVRRMVLRQVAIMTVVGGVLGLIASLWVGARRGASCSR